MRKYITSGLLFFVFCITSCQPEEQAPEVCAGVDYSSHPRHAYYTHVLETFRQQNHAPGALLGVKRINEPLWVGGSGMSNLAFDAPMQNCTLFRTGSITKVFIAVLVLQLQEAGKLSLENSLAVLLPETVGQIPDAEKITVKQLLNNTSGVVDPKNENMAYQLEIVNNTTAMGNMDFNRRLEKYVYGKPLHFSPGTGAAYSNGGYWLLGKILERVEQKPLQKIFEEYLFVPHGLYNTYFEKRDDRNVSHGYANISGKLTDVTAWDRADGDGDPSSGIISTAEDLIRLGERLFQGQIVSPASLQSMLEIVQLPSCPNGDCEFGLGIETYNTQNHLGYGKNGSSSGVDANWIYFPQVQTFIVIFANRGDGNDKSFMDDVLSH